LGANVFAGGLTVSADVVKFTAGAGCLDNDLRFAGIKVLTREQTGKFNWEHYNYV